MTPEFRLRKLKAHHPPGEPWQLARHYESRDGNCRGTSYTYHESHSAALAEMDDVVMWGHIAGRYAS